MPKLSDYVIRFIAEQGIRHVFLVPGGGAMHLNESLSRCPAIEAICNSHEQASAIGAENYAKATNSLGVRLVTTGPGGTNAITGVAGAWLDSTPMLVVSSQVKRPDRMFHPDGSPRGMRQLGVQEVDIISIVHPITKYAITITDPATVRYHLERALHEAATGRPGPVWIDIPLDMQASPIEPYTLPGFTPPSITWDVAAPAADRSAWDRRCRDWKNRYAVVTAEHRQPAGPVSIYNFAETLAAETSADDLLVSGSSGSGIEIFLRACPTRTGQRIFHTAGLGSMGFALPAAIAVCLAANRRRTICVDGDGGFQFNIQELETVRRLQLPIKFFVLNNDGYTSIRASQTNFFGEPRLGCDARTGISLPDISKVAAAYGLATAIIEDQRDLPASIRRVLETPGPVVCALRVIPDEVRAPRLSSHQKPDGSLVSRPLEDLWPFLPHEEFRSNMLIPILEDQ